VLSLVRAGQASANIYGNLLQSLSTTFFVLQDDQPLLIYTLLVLCEHESGLAAESESLVRRCKEAMATMEAVISSQPVYVKHFLLHCAASSKRALSASSDCPSWILQKGVSFFVGNSTIIISKPPPLGGAQHATTTDHGPLNFTDASL
jgi:hypothetical protein